MDVASEIPGSARVSRAGERVLATANLCFDLHSFLTGDIGEKIVSAERRNQHAGCVRSPELVPRFHFQRGLRFSMNACTPSRAASSIMLHAMV